MSPLIQNALAIEQGHTDHIDRLNLLALCEAFGGHEWIGHFTESAHGGQDERIVALCLADAILRGD